ncbi:MAG: decaprenyl-phosphate phosphoribosyltransferase [bacterium]
MKKKKTLTVPPFLVLLWHLFIALRPKQWIKNGFVFAGIIFAGIASKVDDFKVVTIIFVAFCCVSSSGYLFNDVMDIDKDKHHPKKQNRPIAAGKVSVIQAVLLAIVLLVAGFAIALSQSMNVGGLLILYALITFSYSFFFKHVVILDIFMIALGFVVRVAAGAIAISVDLSPWILICTLLLALFLAISKRRAELYSLAHNAGNHRKILQQYTEQFLAEMSSTVTSATIITYSLYAFFISTPITTSISPSSIQRPYMMLTIPVVIYALFRYLYLLHRKKAGESPEDVIFKDIPFFISLVLWALLCYIIIYRKEWLAFISL